MEIMANFTTMSTTQINLTDEVAGSSSISERLADLFTTTGIISFILAALGILANTISILSLLQLQQRRLYLKLLLSLALSDALINVTILGQNFLYVVLDHGSGQLIRSALVGTALILTLLNLMALALDQYAAIVTPFQYTRVMTTARANIVICLIWLISILCGISDFIVGVWSEHPNYWHGTASDEYDLAMLLIGFTFLVLPFLLCVYLRIYCIVRRLLHDSVFMYQYRGHHSKTFITTFLIIISFAICWLPLSLFKISVLIMMQNSNKLDTNTLFYVHECLFILYQVNTLIDPILYAVRLQEVQNGYKRLRSKILCHGQHSTNEADYRRTIHGRFLSDRRHTTPTIMNDNTTYIKTTCQQLEYSGTNDSLERVSVNSSGDLSKQTHISDLLDSENETMIDSFKEPLTLNGNWPHIEQKVNKDHKENRTRSSTTETLLLSPMCEEQNGTKVYGPG